MPPCLDMAKVFTYSHPSDMFLTSLSSVMYLNLIMVDETDAICTAISFSRLIECKLYPYEESDYWVRSVIRLLDISPKLEVLMIDSDFIDDESESEDLPLWHSVPECLSSRLEIFEWEDYGGTREEKKLMTYILENSNCLKTIPIVDAVKTMLLSKRWRFVWTMVPKLDYTDSYKDEKSVWYFLDKSLQQHKAPVLERLHIRLGEQCPVDADVGKWVLDAVNRYVQYLYLDFKNPTSLPKSLYTCKTLVQLTLSGNILVDVPSPVCLPSLRYLCLHHVDYKDQDSHVRLLSSCTVLKDLVVFRKMDDNVTSFCVKVPSLKKLTYNQSNDSGRLPLVIDSPGLHYLKIVDPFGDYGSVLNTPRLVVADVDVVTSFGFHPNDKFLTSFSSVMSLHLILTNVACCSAINFSRLRVFTLRLYRSEYWLEPLMLLLHNSPKLKVLKINSNISGDLSLSWNQPSSVPLCLVTHLEIFEWKEYKGRSEEKQFLAYILANSKCLKTARISTRPSCEINEKQKMKNDIVSMYKASSQLMDDTVEQKGLELGFVDLARARFLEGKYLKKMQLEGSGNSLKHEKVCEDRISTLPDDLLTHILSQIPIVDAVNTAFISKRWRFLWSMMRKLDYTDRYKDKKSVWYFLDKSLQLHKAPLLESLSIHLEKRCPVDPNVGKWVSESVNRCVQALKLDLYALSQPQFLPACLYTCKTLVSLSLSNQILVDVPSPACLPSLQSLELIFVVYRDQDSHVRLLSSCPVLKVLNVVRDTQDNLTSFTVKLPSLQRLSYKDYDSGGVGRSLVIDSPGLRYLKIHDILKDNCTIYDMPRLDVAFVNVDSHQNYKFLTCFSSVMFLYVGMPKVPFCSDINFSRLIELKLSPHYSDTHWLESLMHLLHNSPILKVLMINSVISWNFPKWWNEPSSVPECLLSHLEIFEWKIYRGRSEEKQFLAYILANSKCLKTVGISSKVDVDGLEKKQKELECMYRASPSSQLMFSPQLRGRYED
ncbi:hypothetical protein AALP_AA3G116600 [Arabis alpina]|uniref:F-box domain-containing protein n=1 Tax=Arabis alpina TaxID=50452 RepID=A0A087H8L4_ARAAL|nr:hypothetical protein AALP_AA3G116600 [Arabis alpina]